MTEKRQQELIVLLCEICEELGWVVGVPTDGPDSTQECPGLIICKEEFVYEIVDTLKRALGNEGQAIDDMFDFFSKNPDLTDESSAIVETLAEDSVDNPQTKKKLTYH